MNWIKALHNSIRFFIWKRRLNSYADRMSGAKNFSSASDQTCLREAFDDGVSPRDYFDDELYYGQ